VTEPYEYIEDDPFQGFISNVHDQIREAYMKGLGAGWFDGYEQGFEDGEDHKMYDQGQNPYRSDDDQ
jgi:hypothetical protein